MRSAIAPETMSVEARNNKQKPRRKKSVGCPFVRRDDYLATGVTPDIK